MSPESAPLRVTFLACLIGAAAVFCVPVAAQSNDCDADREVTGQAVDELTHRRLNAAYEAVGEEKYDEAFQELQRLLNRAGSDDYVRAVVSQALAQVEWSRENFDAALGYFETAVSLDALPNQTHFALMYQLAQLYYMDERYDDAIKRLDLWFCTSPEEKITSAAYVLEASIYSAMNDFPPALEAIETAISMEAEPKEQWYRLKLAIHYELEQYPQVGETLEILVSNWPEKKTYWVQLAQIHVQLKRPERALGALALAYRNGLLDSQSDVTFLSSLYSGEGVPYKAAEVLQKGIEDGIVESDRRNWTRVAQEWYSAEELENSLAAYEHAGQASTDGEIDLRRAYILVDLERWPTAKEALDAALEKGGLDDRDTGQAYLLRGMAHFNLEEFDAASADWGRASRYEPTRAAAQQWMAHLQEERRRQAL